MAGKFNHRYVSDVPDSGDDTQASSDEWNDSLVMSEGNDGEVAARESGEDDGWKLRKLGASPSWCDVTQTANSGTATTTLATFTIPANHFDVNKRAVRMKSQVTCAGDTSTKTITVTFGATSIDVNPTTTAPNGVVVDVEFLVMRSTALNAQRYAIRVLIGGVHVEKLAVGTLAIDNASTIAIAIKAAGTASTKVTHNTTTLEFLG